MQEINSKNYSLQVLEEKDIDECAELIGHVFANYSAFLYYLEYKPSDLKETAKKTLLKIVEDKLTVIAKDSNGKIIGCHAGMKLTKINSLKSNSLHKRINLIFDINLEKMQVDEKNSILEELEFVFLKERTL